MSERDPGLQPERTELAWSRTALLLAVIAMLVIRVGITAGDRGLSIAGSVVALLAVSTIVAAHRRRTELSNARPRAPSQWLMLSTSMSIVFAAACSVWAFFR